MIAEILCATLIILGYPRAETSCQYLDTVIDASEENNIDPTILVALIRVESRWNPKVVSRSKACGLTQVLAKYSKYNCKQLKNPITSIDEGAKKLNFWIYKYGKGNIKTGLCGYNAGFRCKGKKRNKTGTRYARKVVKYAKEIRKMYEVKEKDFFLENSTWFEECNE